MRTRLALLLPPLLAVACGGRGMLHMREEGSMSPGTVRVAALHLKSYNGSRATPELAEQTLDENFRRHAELIRLAAGAGARLVVTPEYGMIGRFLLPKYRCHVCTRIPETPTKEPLYLHEDRRIAKHMRDYSRLSRELGIYVVTHVLEEGETEEGRTTYFNAFVAFDPRGRLVANYRKINLWFFENFLETPGDETESFDTPFGTFGMLNCFDVILPLTVRRCLDEHDVDFFVTTSLWQHVPVTGWMAMKSLANLSKRPVVWSNQARGGLGGGAGILRPWGSDTGFGLWGPEGVAVADLPLPERLRNGKS